ncbi:hypothetical protein K438DRAFT_1991236 [Mycena galopus ATCC 62051]|nr:hypothetical protein K438DRAFT_1991236 [Mycena galopus ATCC 62051]
MSDYAHKTLVPSSRDERTMDSSSSNLEIKLKGECHPAPNNDVVQPTALRYLAQVLSACRLPLPSPGTITVLREGDEKGRQAVFNVAGRWIVRIFELHAGYRKPAEFVSRILEELERANAPAERIRHHGILADTAFHGGDTALHYTVTEFIDGIPLTLELRNHPDIRQQISSLFLAMDQISVPVEVDTVSVYMGPRLERLRAMLSSVSADVAAHANELISPLSDFSAFRMVVSHCDMAPENILGCFKPSVINWESVSISVIDWEFVSYVPEFRIGVPLATKMGREIWGADFLNLIHYGPYSDKVIWTEKLCMLAEDYEGCEVSKFEELVKESLLLKLAR